MRDCGSRTLNNVTQLWPGISLACCVGVESSQVMMVESSWWRKVGLCWWSRNELNCAGGVDLA